MATTAARRRFLIARASIAKRRAANDATVFAVPPAGPFGIRMSFEEDVSRTALRADGLMTISDARLFLADGSEIDGATVVVDPDAYERAYLHFNLCEEDLKGTLITTDDGYRLIGCDSVHVPIGLHRAA